MSATLKNGINLAFWLYRIHPEIFAALQAPASQARSRTALRGLGDDFTPAAGDFVPFDSSSYDAPSFTVDTSAPIDVTAALDPVIVSLPDPQLSTVGIDSALTPPPASIDFGTAAAAPASSSGGLGGALASIGSFLSSATGLSSLTNLATAVYKANTPQSAAIAAQIGRVQAGVNPAPITYGYNAAGQLVPVLKSPNTAGIALTPQTLAGLIPAGWTPYVVPVVIGIVVLWAFSGSRK